jgi:hypothetical protein
MGLCGIRMARVLTFLALACCIAYAQQERVDVSKPRPERTSRTAKPKFFPRPDKYQLSVYVTIQDSTPEAVIYYTTDGSTPTIESNQYVKPVLINSNTTLKAIAVAPEHTSSTEISGKYEVEKITLGTMG